MAAGYAPVRERPAEGDARPRTSAAAPRSTPIKSRAVQALLMVAAGLIAASLLFPFWSMRLRAPQYPGGLQAQIFITHLEGDVRELNNLNHYIGMMKLDEAAALERSIAVYLLPAFALLTLAAAFVQRRWWMLLVVPALGLPVVFMLDLGAWLFYAGHALDPRAPLSSSIKPFTPPLLGEGKIGQFAVFASFEIGFYMVLAAAVLITVALVLQRRALAKL
ncbi:MAG: cytochrome C [Chloroflexi bacterium]|nr:cytochrome C [Chloroflexota bacterium]